uniref:Uncharacterized protein n=1 Tax=Rhizophora mucronata TaxID=61149 RepID=A0A2P2JDB1_RHIMU
MGSYQTASFGPVLSHIPILHSYNVNGTMSVAQSPALSFRRFISKLPSRSKYPKISGLSTRIRRGDAPKAPNLTVRAASESQETSITSPNNTRVILASSAITVALAVANRVLYKLALVPMKHYPFFLAQFTTFGYVVIYFSILYARYRAGIVTIEMLALPKSRFVAVGVLEALGVAAGMASAAMLPGPAIPILSQTFLVWQLVFSTLLLGRTYSFNQVIGCLLVAVGVVVAVSGEGL